MAPKRKDKTENGEPKPSAAAATTRITRSSTRRGNAGPAKAPADPEPPKKKKPKITSATAEPKPDIPPPPPSSEADSMVRGTYKTIIIEHCKQCNSFKTRALQVKSGLEEEVAGVNVLVNPEKPRRGCFEIREEDGEIFVSLLDLKRPFKKMKDLDMGEVISDIIEKIK